MKSSSFAAAWLASLPAIGAQNYTVSLPYCPTPETVSNRTSGGGAYGIAVSTTPGVKSTITTASGVYSFIGFYPTSPNDPPLSGATSIASDIRTGYLTLESCAASCAASNVFAVLGATCFCGSDTRSDSPVYSPSTYFACPGNRGEACGAPGLAIAYRVSPSGESSSNLAATSTSPNETGDPGTNTNQASTTNQGSSGNSFATAPISEGLPPTGGSTVATSDATSVATSVSTPVSTPGATSDSGIGATTGGTSGAATPATTAATGETNPPDPLATPNESISTSPGSSVPPGGSDPDSIPLGSDGISSVNSVPSSVSTSTEPSSTTGLGDQSSSNVPSSTADGGSTGDASSAPPVTSNSEVGSSTTSGGGAQSTSNGTPPTTTGENSGDAGGVSVTGTYAPILTQASCPKDDYTQETDPLGVVYKINCDLQLRGDNLQPLHADNLDACLQNCDMRSGCAGTTYVDATDAGGTNENCYPYSRITGYSDQDVVQSLYAAVAVEGPNNATEYQDNLCEDPNYGDGSQYTDVYADTFDISCGKKLTTGVQLAGMAMDSLLGCLTYCSLYPGCVAVVFTGDGPPPPNTRNCFPYRTFVEADIQDDSTSSVATLNTG